MHLGQGHSAPFSKLPFSRVLEWTWGWGGVGVGLEGGAWNLLLRKVVLGLGLSLYPGEDHLRNCPLLQRPLCNLDKLPGPKAEIGLILKNSPPAGHLGFHLGIRSHPASPGGEASGGVPACLHPVEVCFKPKATSCLHQQVQKRSKARAGEFRGQELRMAIQPLCHGRVVSKGRTSGTEPIPGPWA